MRQNPTFRMIDTDFTSTFTLNGIVHTPIAIFGSMDLEMMAQMHILSSVRSTGRVKARSQTRIFETNQLTYST